MKKLIATILIFVLLASGFAYRAPLVSSAQNLIYYSTCDKPKTFRIGSIDPKYNMTKDNFLVNIQNAGALWSNAYGKELFKYDPQGNIEINLVYDQRSFLSTQIDQLNSRVKEQQKTLDPEIANYKNRSAQFRAKVTQLNSDIEYWNARGGAPSEEYDKLKSRQTALQQEADVLAQEAERLNQSTEEYNSQVGELHKTVDTFNQELSFKPEEGEYIIDRGKETINIYFDNSQTELIHTLAHELGHALGISHNNNTLSIMYPRTTEATTLSTDDIAGLHQACEKKSVIENVSRNFSLIIDQLRLRFTQ